MLRIKVMVSIISRILVVEYTGFRRKCCASQRGPGANSRRIVHVDDIVLSLRVGVSVQVGQRQGEGVQTPIRGHMTTLYGRAHSESVLTHSPALLYRWQRL